MPNKLDYPATQRNRQAILEVIQNLLKSGDQVLEIASGSGQHADFFVKQLPGVVWQPSDINSDALDSIAAYRSDANSSYFLNPIELDVCKNQWPECHFDMIVCINMIHISPVETIEALFSSGSSICRAKQVYLYGPFFEAGKEPAESNIAFDYSLKSRNSAWGIRGIEQINETALRYNFALKSRWEMPANNLSLLYSAL